jgi:hypothetical protein
VNLPRSIADFADATRLPSEGRGRSKASATIGSSYSSSHLEHEASTALGAGSNLSRSRRGPSARRGARAALLSYMGKDQQSTRSDTPATLLLGGSQTRAFRGTDALILTRRFLLHSKAGPPKLLGGSAPAPTQLAAPADVPALDLAAPKPSNAPHGATDPFTFTASPALVTAL